MIIAVESIMFMFSWKQPFRGILIKRPWKHAANLQENTHVEMRFRSAMTLQHGCSPAYFQNTFPKQHPWRADSVLSKISIFFAFLFLICYIFCFVSSNILANLFSPNIDIKLPKANKKVSIANKICRFIQLCRSPNQKQGEFQEFKSNLEIYLDGLWTNNPFLTVMITMLNKKTLCVVTITIICSNLASFWKFQYFRRPIYNPVEYLWWSFYCKNSNP